ncbi:hypothetical protein SUGI_1052570 [Cryptomeria japonica]|nr:hypothetical protein SUGI_1052570 [Cryptomeria japonica]
MTGCLLLLFMATEESLTSAMENMGVASEVAQAKYSRRVLIKSIIKRPDGEQGLSGQSVVVGGWVRTSRAHGGITFIQVNDGFCFANLQVLVNGEIFPLGQLTPTGTCVMLEGELTQPPDGKEQKVELKLTKVLGVGTVDPRKYPIAKTYLPLEHLRSYVHLRARTNTVWI